ncbi:MAG TPA: segregation/condensation protein A [Planctomycetota bacterium]|nr:segregation/condensation protein A [Planctomycetota bacterium]
MTEQLFELENFRGPMDLLLHLVREQEVEITEVDLSRLCDQYLKALNVLDDLDINVAGEFLVMASTLLLIKSRAILPREEVDLSEELDPGDELILQLLEYRKFKSLAMELGARGEQRALRFPRGASEVPPDDQPTLEEVSVWDLVGTFARLTEELGLKRSFDTLRQEKPLKEYLRAVLDELHAQPQWTFRELLLAAGDRDGIFGVFLSVLELTKTGQIRVEQGDNGGEIVLRLREDRDESLLAGIFQDAAVPLTATLTEPDDGAGRGKAVAAAEGPSLFPGAADRRAASSGSADPDAADAIPGDGDGDGGDGDGGLGAEG